MQSQEPGTSASNQARTAHQGREERQGEIRMPSPDLPFLAPAHLEQILSNEHDTISPEIPISEGESPMNLEHIQQALRAEGLDGWLFYDFRRSNPVAHRVLSLPDDEMYTRRWFYFVPVKGTPGALVSAVESHLLRSLPGERHIFQTWQRIHAHLCNVLRHCMRIAMEYSPMNAIPYMSRVDAGTVELVRSYGVEVVSSANLAQRFVAQLSDEQVESHREAGRRLIAAKDALFAALASDLRAGAALDEYSVQQRFTALLQQAGLVLPNPPHVAVNANASNPHYVSTDSIHAPIRRGDLVLFDFSAKRPPPASIIAA